MTRNMTRNTKRKTLLIAAIAMLPMLAPTAAEARNNQSKERCKTYTKTMSIDGRRAYASGKACERKDGVWQIVRIGGSNATRYFMREHIIDSLYSRGYDVIGYGHRYDRRYSGHGYYDREHRGAYRYSRNYGQYKKHYKQGYKNKPRVHYHDGRECSVRH